MNVRRTLPPAPLVLKAIAGVLVGIGIGTLLPPEPVALPALGTVPGLAVGLPALVAGVAVYLSAPRVLGSPECGCGGDCGCS